MNSIWYGIGSFLQKSFDLLLVSFGWTPVVLFSIVVAFGLAYWMYCQVRFTRRDKERGTLI